MFDTQTLWMRLSERDEVNLGRIDIAIQQARRLNNPFAQYPSEDALRVQALREQFPYYDLKDVTPHLDRLRLIKSAREIEILRYNGRISAEAIRRAIAISRPGRFEYEMEAEATHWMVKHGMQAGPIPPSWPQGPTATSGTTNRASARRRQGISS
jgi:Xaa-Pro aminopeptidase